MALWSILTDSTWVESYSPQGWTKVLGVGGQYDWDDDLAKNLTSVAMALLPAALALLGLILALVVLFRLCCCGPKAGDHTRRGRSCWPSMIWAGLAFGLVAIGVIIFLATARHGVSIADGLIKDAAADANSAVDITASLNATGHSLVMDLDALPQKCENAQFRQTITDQVKPLRDEVQTYVQQVDKVVGIIEPINNQLQEANHGPIRDYEGATFGLAAVPIVLTTLACLVMIVSVMGTAMCCRPGSCCAKLEDACLFKLGAIFLALTIFIVAIVSAVQLLFGIALSNVCQDPDTFVLNVSDALMGPNTTWYRDHGDLELRLVRYYVAAEGTNPIQEQIDGAAGNLTEAQDNLNQALSFSQVMSAACGDAWKTDVARLSAAINGNITEAKSQLNQTNELFAPAKVYPYYQKAVHEQTCNVVIDGLAWLSLFQFLVGLIALPCLSCRAASFVHRRAVEQEAETEQLALAEQGQGHQVLG